MEEESKFFTYSWTIDDTEEEVTVIRIYGINENNENVCVRVENFTPYVYLELPTNINWSASKAQLVGNKIDELLGRQKPQAKVLQLKHKLYGAFLDEKGNKKLFPYLFCSFSNPKDIKALGYKIRKPIPIVGIGSVKLRMHESDADPILQLTSCRNIPTAGWVKFVGKRVEKQDKTTICHHEFIVRWKNLAPINDDTVPKPKIMGFDIEVNSTNPTMMPQAHKPGDKIFQISCVFTHEPGNVDKYTSYLITLGNPDKNILENINIITCKTEAEILEQFTKLIRTENPNLIAGYNILGFDIPYMIKREAVAFPIDFRKMGFHKFNIAKQKTIKWSSSAYKNQEFEFLDAEGRVFIDLLPLVRRDYKMNNYKLKTISEYFIGDTKDDLSHQGIFKCYRIGTTVQEDGEYSAKAKKAMAICGKYCVKDSILVVRLMDKLQTWVGLTEMAKTCHVPIFALYTQGQQIKVYSQIYHYCMYNNIVVEKDAYQTGEDERYMGAYVFDPVPGKYEYVVSFDFSSLYPSTIIAYNIDYSTWVTDESIPDDKCHVMNWEEHLACQHDPNVIRRLELNDFISKEEVKIKELRAKRDKSKGLQKEEYKKQIEELLEYLKPYKSERSDLLKHKPKHVTCCERKYRFLKEPKGVLPTIIQNLLDARKNTRKNMKTLDKKKDDLLINVLDKRQLAYKVSANSMYGALGVRRGYLPFMPGAMCTTFMGRTNIQIVAKTIQEKYGGKLIYGDSVSGDTPILIRYTNETVDLIPIEKLGKIWKDYDEFKEDDIGLSEKEQSLIDAEVWCYNKWTKIKRVIRHKTYKKMYRVLTNTGCVDVTEDHSLISNDKKQVKPTEVNIGSKLLHSFPKNFEEYNICTVQGGYEFVNCSKCKNQKPSYEFYWSETKQEYCKICKECVYYQNNPDTDKKYFSDHEYMNVSHEITKEEAFVWGFFMADGSGGFYENSKKYSWAINNQNLDYLNRAKQYLEVCEPNYKFKILETMESSNVYKLVPQGKVRLIAQKYHQLLYSDKYKIVPYVILNASEEVREMFLEGYYTGDGYKSEKDRIIPKTGLRMDCKGKIGSQGLYYLLKSLGYNVSINTREDKPDIFRINATKNYMRKDKISIKKIIDIGFSDDYVYDIETEEGIFHAGIGELVVKNTDSNYVSFPQLKTSQDIWDYSIKVAKEVSQLFPKPINIQ